MVRRGQDPYTGGHLWWVSRYARLLGEEAGLPAAEYAIVRTHSERGWRMLSQHPLAELVKGIHRPALDRAAPSPIGPAGCNKTAWLASNSCKQALLEGDVMKSARGAAALFAAMTLVGAGGVAHAGQTQAMQSGQRDSQQGLE